MPLVLGVTGGETVFRFDTSTSSVTAIKCERISNTGESGEFHVMTTNRDAVVMQASSVMGDEVNRLPECASHLGNGTRQLLWDLHQGAKRKLKALIGHEGEFRAHGSSFGYGERPFVISDQRGCGMVYGFVREPTKKNPGTLPRASFEFVHDSGNHSTTAIFNTDLLRRCVSELSDRQTEQYLVSRIMKRASKSQIGDVLHFFSRRACLIEQLVSLTKRSKKKKR